MSGYEGVGTILFVNSHSQKEIVQYSACYYFQFYAIDLRAICANFNRCDLRG